MNSIIDAGSGVGGVPPRPVEGVITWNVTTVCNLRCSYCTQRQKADRGRPPRAWQEFLPAFGRLPGRWEIKMSGGEPFSHPHFDDLVAGVAQLGHRISVVTNFTASRERLAAFASAARGRVGIFACSLHLEHVADDARREEFIARALWFAGVLAAAADPELPRPSLCITTVATRAALPHLAGLGGRVREAGIPFKVQPEKQDRDVVAYTPEERAAILALGGHNLTGGIEHCFRGQPCWAGSRSFILDDLGVAWRCYPARRYKTEPLGNFTNAGFQLAEEPRPCRYGYCNCTVPIARGMMQRTPAQMIEEEP